MLDENLMRSFGNKIHLIIWIFSFQVFDDVAVELTMAILQFFQNGPNEDQIFRACKALVRFLEVSALRKQAK